MKACKNCKIRAPGCHDTCKTYQEEKAEHNAKVNYFRKFTDGFGHDGCLTPKHGRIKRFDRTRF